MTLALQRQSVHRGAVQVRTTGRTIRQLIYRRCPDLGTEIFLFVRPETVPYGHRADVTENGSIQRLGSSTTSPGHGGANHSCTHAPPCADTVAYSVRRPGSAKKMAAISAGAGPTS